MSGKRYVLAITGASGALYGLKLGKELLQRDAEVTILLSEAGLAVLREECGLDWQGEESVLRRHVTEYFGNKRVRYFGLKDFTAPAASGSGAADAMVVCPASMGTVARIACGLSTNLIERCADVMLKERRPLVLVPRETPLSEIHLENLLKVARAGARVVPAMPGFYHHPVSLDDLVDFVVGKTLDVLGVEHSLFRRWGAEADVP